MTEIEKPKLSFFTKAKERVLEELKTGTSPQKIALSLALGASIGIFPLIGTTMALCALLGFILRLNPVSIQVANYAAYPFQVFLIIPFLKLGAYISDKELDLSWAYKLTEGDSSKVLEGLSHSAGYAVLGWVSVVPVPALFSYFLLLFLVKKANQVIRKS
ncbi:DUF2062 domain-containing protein [Leptospira sarikeiensis]|uniref:DUF2062 domain-containing protein n=1 Tax=Leptospira sarikeiensis TaxID=2484943 RepID=A0A4R9K293_9LEPT|nr:DUF2062 domain-containing protein [Leptospira sarikeiensis]TGL58964.1 DUF2062 domain-containing protein [Leptospira sarikeiensis]